MQVITITSDMGNRDFYLAILKGKLACEAPTAQIMDITNAIPPGNTAIGAFSLKNAWKHFPPGTIHLVAVDTNLYGNVRHILFAYEGHYFIGTDNGIFSMALEGRPSEVIEITAFDNPGVYAFPAAFLFPRIVAGLLSGKQPAELGTPTFALSERTQLNAVTDDDLIKGAVLYVDSNGNLLTNLDKEMFERHRKNRKFSILVRKSDYSIRKISKFYSDVPDGEMVALFNHAGILELALNTGNLSKMMGMGVGDVVRIEFYD